MTGVADAVGSVATSGGAINGSVVPVEVDRDVPFLLPLSKVESPLSIVESGAYPNPDVPIPENDGIMAMAERVARFFGIRQLHETRGDCHDSHMRV
jgi:hypothetical protein